MLVHDVQTESAETDLVWISDLLDVANSLRMNVFLGSAREAVYECEIALLYAFKRDLEVFLRLIWDIVL